MRVLMVSEFYPPVIGGIGHYVQALSKEMMRHGHHVAVATLGHEGCPALDEDEGMSVYRINGWNTLLTPLYENKALQFHPTVPDPGVMAKLSRVIKLERPDIIHVHGWMLYSLMGLRAVTKAKIVATLHDNSLICPTRAFVHNDQTCTGPAYTKCVRCASSEYGPKYAALKAALLTSGLRVSSVLHQLVDQYIAVSSAVRDTNRLATANSPHAIEVVPNFVADDLASAAARFRRPDFLPDGDGYILFAGRSSPNKGLGVLLEAYNGLSDLAPLVVIVAEEQGEPRQFPPGVIVARNISRHEVMAAWAHCGVGVVPSTGPDSCPTATIEAMACGKPVVASAIGGLLDQVRDGETGVLVSPRNADALRKALRMLLLDSVRREQMGEAARKHARNFMVSTVAARIEQIYATLLSGTGSPTQLVAPPEAQPSRDEGKHRC